MFNYDISYVKGQDVHLESLSLLEPNILFAE